MRSIAVVFVTVCLILGISVAAMAADAHQHDNLTVHGTITSIDLGRTTFTTHSKAHGTLTFTLAPRAQLLDDGTPTTFGALKVGDVVKVHFTPDTSPLAAERVDIVATPRPH